MKIFSKNFCYGLFIVIVFASLMAFFTAHPLYIYDTDDWYYISFSRHAIPSVNQWNPTKILPETLLPLCAEIAVRFIMPCMGDYIGAMGIVFAIVVSISIIGYMISFGNYLSSQYGLSEITTVLLITLILLFHFLPFNTNIAGNMHMFWADNVNCVFNYTIPGLLNAILFFFLSSRNLDNLKENKRILVYGILVLTMYLSINSNMFQSIMISSLAGANLLISAITGGQNAYKKKGKFKLCVKEYCHKNSLWLFILTCWFVSLVFEAKGGRASKAIPGFWKLPIGETTRYFISILVCMNKIYIAATITIIIIAVLLFIYRKQRSQLNLQDTKFLKNIGIHFICLSLNIIYLILLCAKVNPHYIKRSYVLFGIIFYLMVITASSFVYIINIIPSTVVIVPLLLYILLFETVIDGKTFAEFNVPQYSGKQIKILDNYYINQIIDADKSGLTEVEIHVARHPSDIWPLGIQHHSDKITRSLYNHGLISRIIPTSMIADDMVNKTYHLSE